MNIFIVEDERWALAELVEQFKVYESEHAVYAFDNGDDALSAVGALRPQLVITDINMPGIDGLEMIEQLYALDPAIKSMILSVHDQFEYARQGMKFGVVDYLLKPVKKEVLFKAVDKAVRHIENDSKQREEWLSGSIAQMLLAAEVPDYQILKTINLRVCCMALLVLENGPAAKGWKDTYTDFNELIQRWTQEAFHRGDIHFVDLDCKQRVLLIPLRDCMQTNKLRDSLSDLLQQLQRLAGRVHLGYAVKTDGHTLYETFHRLQQSMNEQMLFGMSTFLSPEMIRQDVEIGGVWEKVRMMESLYRKSEIHKGQQVLKQLLEELRQRQITKRQLRLVVHDMLFSLKYKLLAPQSGMVNMTDLQEDMGIINQFNGYDELFEWLQDKIVSLYFVREPVDMNPKGLIFVLIQLIHHNYQGTISLQQFSADHHVSLGYLSRMFKSQTGRTFSEYVAGYRINKAKELLTGGVDRVQEVSHLVGYEDTKHFSALFKKIVGEAPIAYAKRNAVKGKIPPVNRYK